MANPRRKRGLHKSNIHVANVIADHQYRAANSTQILAALYSRPSEQEYGGTHQQIMREQANPRHRPALRPSRIVIAHTRRRLAAQHGFEIADSFNGSKSRFAQIHLIAIFQCAEQFNPVERTEIQIVFQTCIRAQLTGVPSHDAGKKFCQGARSSRAL